MKHIIIILLFVLFSCVQKNDSDKQGHSQEQKVDTTYSFCLDIQKAATGFIYVVSCTTHVGPNKMIGQMLNFYPQSLFYGYDSTVVNFKDLNVIPLSEGRTKIYLRNPIDMKLTADSIVVFVTKFNKKLEISVQRTA